LLTQWTYQAMVHGMLGIENNLVDLSKISAEKKPEQPQIVLSAEQDPFYKENMFSNFGDLGTSFRNLVEQYQIKSKQTRPDAKDHHDMTIEEMKAFVKNIPDIKKLGGNVTKHMTLIEELQRQVKNRRLLDVSELEQELACVENHDRAVTKLNAIFQEKNIQPNELLKLVLLYVLRYETHKDNKISNYILMLTEKCSPEDVKLIKTIRAYSGIQKRSKSVDLFNNKSFMQIAMTVTKTALVGVENVYTQHVPLISNLINDIKKNDLSESSYPFLKGVSSNSKTQQIIIFMVGGATYEEAAYVAKLNTHSINILLGSTHMLNSTSFLNALKENEMPDVDVQIDM